MKKSTLIRSYSLPDLTELHSNASKVTTNTSSPTLTPMDASTVPIRR